jgi:hypothetical protein
MGPPFAFGSDAIWRAWLTPTPKAVREPLR